jgi:hypothetical protein
MTQEELQKDFAVVAEQMRAFRAKVDGLHSARFMFEETLSPLISDVRAIQSELALTLATIGSLSYADLETHRQRFIGQALRCHNVRGLTPLGVEAGNYDEEV